MWTETFKNDIDSFVEINKGWNGRCTFGFVDACYMTICVFTSLLPTAHNIGKMGDRLVKEDLFLSFRHLTRSHFKESKLMLKAQELKDFHSFIVHCFELHVYWFECLGNSSVYEDFDLKLRNAKYWNYILRGSSILLYVLAQKTGNEF